MDHIITVQSDDGRLLADCSCGYGLTPSRLQRITLAELNELAREHIGDVEHGALGHFAASCLSFRAT